MIRDDLDQFFMAGFYPIRHRQTHIDDGASFLSGKITEKNRLLNAEEPVLLS
jgi:hypothetical protein